jgi:ABC-type branched-subunit amino acid transport system substrate-binding protein
MRTGTRVAMAAATIGIAALAAGCGGGGGGASADGGSTLALGSLWPFTGDLSAISAPLDKAVKLAASESTAAAKAAGLKLTVTAQAGDTQGDPQSALQAARKAIDGGASCLIGPATTPEAQAILTSVTKVRAVPMLPVAGGDAVSTFQDDGTVFRTVPANRLQSVALLGAVEKALGGARGKRVAFAYQNSPYGEDFVKAFTTGFRRDGGTIQGPIAYDPNQGSYDAEAAKIVAGNPDAYVIVDYPDTYAKVGAALLRTGRFDAGKLFVPTTLALPRIPKSIPRAALEGAHGVRVGSPSDTPQAKAFDERYTKAPGASRGSLDTNAFDAGVLCFLASVAADSTKGEDIAKALPKVAGPPGRKYTFLQLADAVKALRAGRDIDYEGVSGPIDFDRNGDPTTQLFDFYTYRQGVLTVDRQGQVGG